MVQFWKDVAERVSVPFLGCVGIRVLKIDPTLKAPHHSRASWMKYWRRHKHELEPDENGQALAPLPEKKLRYSTQDDILLARYFATRPAGTSDQMFQAFARMVSPRRIMILMLLFVYVLMFASSPLAPASSLERMARAS